MLRGRIAPVHVLCCRLSLSRCCQLSSIHHVVLWKIVNSIAITIVPRFDRLIYLELCQVAEPPSEPPLSKFNYIYSYRCLPPLVSRGSQITATNSALRAPPASRANLSATKNAIRSGEAAARSNRAPASLACQKCDRSSLAGACARKWRAKSVGRDGR